MKSTKTGLPSLRASSRAALEKGCHCKRSACAVIKGKASAAAAVAAALHRAYALGWVCATVASTLLLLLPLPLQTRTVVALLCGPLVGIGVHLAALARG